ncbi:MAG: phosphonate transport system substrate-binding protein [Gammaproteobacteria bacterium]|jgi:phosphonate transport system substrate-binding protein
MTSLFANNEQSQLSFGVVPQQSAKTLAAKWGPVFDRWSQESGIKIKFVTAKNIPTFEERLLQGKYDIAYMNPYHYVLYHQAAGYLAMAREQDRLLQGIIVVHKDSHIYDLEDLQKVDMAFPAPASFAATIIPLANLAKMNISTKATFVYSHDSVYLNVAKGFFKAGGGVMRTLKSTPAGVQDKLRVVWKSEGFTPHAIASHPRVSDETREKLLSALERLQKDDNFMQLLRDLNLNPFVRAQVNDWDSIKDLNIIGITDHLAPPMRVN